MKKILLSCFGPFGGQDKNSSEEVAKFINRENVDKIGLKVSYQNDFQTLRNAILASQYDLILMLGQARGREAVSLEARSTNLNNHKSPDNDGFYPNEEIYPGFSHYLYTKIDLERLKEKINLDKVSISKNAGSYLCNFLYYSCLKEIDLPSLFVHLPALSGAETDPKIPTMSLEEEIKIINAIIDALCEED